MSNEHLWVDPGHNHPYWEERACEICGLTDMRVREDQRRGSVCAEWRVTLPCIEPPPPTVVHADLVREMREHKLSFTPHAYGYPGDWVIGLGAGNNYPRLTASSLESGWSQLLRWLRARQFDPHKHSQFAEAKSYADRSYSSYDDDD